MRVLTLTAAAVFVIDQITKYWVLHVLNLDRVRSIDLIPPWLNLRMAWNQGVNFGLMSSETDLVRWGLIAVGLVVCVWVFLWVRRAGGVLAQLAAGLLIGGALGNVLDRLTYGAVADFLNMSLPNWTNPYSFNVADIAIFAGALGLILLPQGATAPRNTRAEPPVRRKPRPPKGEPPLTRAKNAGKPATKVGEAVAAEARPAVKPVIGPAEPKPAKPRDAGKPLG